MGRISVLWMLGISAVILLIVLIMQPISVFHFGPKIALLFPQGIIAAEERSLLIILQAIMLLVIIPVYILTFIFSWKFRYNNPKATYDPDLVDNKLAEYIWWGLPFVIVVIIAALTWIKTYELDPFKPLKSDKKPLAVQVVALQWQWLFLYPEHNVASINLLQIPKDTPINFEITADAPMNSFWIPSLGGQIYAMPNMKTKLHLIAEAEGDFMGSSANISGEGFANMYFTTRSVSEKAFDEWLAEAKQSQHRLNFDSYRVLAKPTKEHFEKIYQLTDNNLFDQILDQYMHPKE